MNVQLCYDWDQVKQIPLPAIVNPKFDGVRAYCIGGKFFSRQNKTLQNVNELAGQVAELGPFVFDGELVEEDWNKTISTVHTQYGGDGTKIHYHIFDILTLEEWNGQRCDKVQIVRSAILKKLEPRLPDRCHLVPIHIVDSVEKIAGLLAVYVKQGYEGIVVKDPHAPYAFKRHRSWIKLKPHKEETFLVTGMVEGTGKYQNMMGALEIQVGSVTCRLGTGFDDRQRKQMWENSPVGKLVEVRYQEKTSDGLLRFPSFLRLRLDLPSPTSPETSTNS